MEETRKALNGRTATWEDLDGLVHTRRTVLEALRMHPPGRFLTRQTTAPTRLGDHNLPTGTTVGFSPYLATHEPSRHLIPIGPAPAAGPPDQDDTHPPLRNIREREHGPDAGQPHQLRRAGPVVDPFPGEPALLGDVPAPGAPPRGLAGATEITSRPALSASPMRIARTPSNRHP